MTVCVRAPKKNLEVGDLMKQNREQRIMPVGSSPNSRAPRETSFRESVLQSGQPHPSRNASATCERRRTRPGWFMVYGTIFSKL